MLKGAIRRLLQNYELAGQPDHIWGGEPLSQGYGGLFSTMRTLFAKKARYCIIAILDSKVIGANHDRAMAIPAFCCSVGMVAAVGGHCLCLTDSTAVHNGVGGRPRQAKQRPGQLGPGCPIDDPTSFSPRASLDSIRRMELWQKNVASGSF